MTTHAQPPSTADVGADHTQSAPDGVRRQVVDALRLDLVGPWPGHQHAEEHLPRHQRPSTWYLTGFLAPRAAPPEQASDDDADDELGVAPGPEGLVEEQPTDPAAAKKVYYPSSMGLSFLVPSDAQALSVRVSWGDYVQDEVPKPDGDESMTRTWHRIPRSEVVDLPLNEARPEPTAIPDSNGLTLDLLVREIPTKTLGDRIPDGTRSVSVFLVNARRPDPDAPDRAFVFQPILEVECGHPFVPRPDLRGLRTEEFDDDIADLHYADAHEFASGHGVSADWDELDGQCRVVRTAWIASADVLRTETAAVPDVEVGMEALGELKDASDVKRALGPLAERYREWIAARVVDATQMPGGHAKTAKELMRQAGLAADRIARGVRFLEQDPDALDAFRVANRAVGRALTKRLKLDTEPTWRPFQLAFILLNIAGIADPTDRDRDTVDLLFFPTGGGKTEAYLGLAAFAMVLRRLKHRHTPGGMSGAGVSVVMRYTLRLLTLDQLGRAAGLVCALELERGKDQDRYGVWPFEIGLWVGRAATPNVMGKKGDSSDSTARARVRSYKRDPKYRKPPIPIESCPWCDTPLEPQGFNLVPNDDHPTDLRISCMNPDCEFTGGRRLPIVAVDEPVYRRLPAFLIATVDKFAALPWTGPSGGLLGGATSHDANGFFGPALPGSGRRLETPIGPPDLIIQDELHLISGPLGTMAGLFETAIDALCTREVDGKTIRPKVVASTATARRAQSQVQALFGRHDTALFPPPGIDRRDSFFARVAPTSERPARQYLGISAQGRNAKVVMRRVWTTIMAAAEKAYVDNGGKDNPENPADPYMTVLGYFNSLRELGGARRILEEEVRQTVRDYGRRLRIGETEGMFRDRRRIWDVIELTSRVPTDRVSEARDRLKIAAEDGRWVECAVATNMISVGLDISRLGLMVVLGQPKSHAEYIQATSRVGRDEEKPGLVITLLNLAKPRDRSHYERFRHYHETFYRSVEVSSVTPFAARALDRGFAASMIALARHARVRLTPPTGANEILGERTELEAYLRQVFAERVRGQPLEPDEVDALLHRVESRIPDLLDAWSDIRAAAARDHVTLRYQQHEGNGGETLLREILDHSTDAKQDKFRLNRSLRDVEPDVPLYLEDLPVDTWRDAP